MYRTFGEIGKRTQNEPKRTQFPANSNNGFLWGVKNGNIEVFKEKYHPSKGEN